MLSAQDMQEAAAHGRAVKAIYVYEAPVRLWHWVNALAIVVLAASGWFIASPPPSQPGEASAHFLMGYIRFAHFAAGYILLVGFLGRLYWAFVGNGHARQIFMLPILNRRWWGEVMFELRWYLFLEKDPKKYVGHNPMAQLVMFLLFTTTVTFMIGTGFALYGEGAQAGSWAHALFTSWVMPLFGDSQKVHTWHHVGMWLMVLFVMAHVYAALREDIMSRQSLVSTMLSGWRMFKDDRP
jgi:Ni/Fe-hydrogenase 1 B-type cytochrome subunit